MKKQRVGTFGRLSMVLALVAAFSLSGPAAEASSWSSCAGTVMAYHEDPEFYALYAYNTSVTKVAPVNFLGRAITVRREAGGVAKRWFYGSWQSNGYYNLPENGGTLHVSIATSTWGVGSTSSSYHMFETDDYTYRFLVPEIARCVF